jgi:hypothetical protein
MSQLPFLLRVSQPSTAKDVFRIDGATSEDPLPVALESTPDGYIFDRGTSFTDVKHETTDDN